MRTLLIKLLFPAWSPQRKFAKNFLARFKARRMNKYARNRYNANRQLYYAHALTKLVKEGPLVSVVVPCFNTPAKYFEPLLASIFAQGYQNWELVLVDASTEHASSEYIKRRAEADTRITYIKTTNEGIALNTNKGLKIAKGEYIAFLDHDDTLDPDALADSVDALSDEIIGLVYSDEDKVSDDGSRYFQPHFKPDFSLDMLRNVNYITHFVVVRKSVVEELKGIREGFDGAQDFDFLLRAVDLGIKIRHIPKILYHWREAEGSTAADFSNKTHVTDAGCKALDDHYQRNKIVNVKAKAIENRPGFYAPVYTLSKRSRAIWLNLSKYNLSQPEMDFIVAKYTSNKNVAENDIEITSSPPTNSNSAIFKISAPIVPASKTTDIASMFALSEEGGVSSVSPKIIRQGKIFDMGIVAVDGHDKYLFRGLSPDKPLWFGSLEWVRNVSKPTGNAVIATEQKEGRHVIWSHAEFVALIDEKTGKISNKAPNYYNLNLEEQTEIVEAASDYIVDLIKVKQ